MRAGLILVCFGLESIRAPASERIGSVSVRFGFASGRFRFAPGSRRLDFGMHRRANRKLEARDKQINPLTGGLRVNKDIMVGTLFEVSLSKST